VIPVLNLIRLFFLAIVLTPLALINREKFFYYYFNFAGPSFIKLGQMLATRPDLIGKELAIILSKFQDKVKPFSHKKARRILQQELAGNLEDFFKEFSKQPIASASIAQVHKAKTIDNKLVAVKLLRPNISKKIYRDISTLKLITKVSRIFSNNIYKFLSDILQLLQENAKSELDLTIEATNCSQIKDNLKDLSGFYVPNIYWTLTTKKMLVTQWLEGIPFSDKKTLMNSNFDKNIIAKNLVLSYFTQVYKYGFFHGDMHPGNLFLLKNGDIGIVDFGIVGIIDEKTRIAIAQIVIGFINKDYEKIARLHIQSGLVPKNTNLKKLALNCRKIGETVVGSKVKDIPLANLLQNLINMTQDFKMSTKPELLLLQKTILLIEGIGSTLNPEINIWDYAKPWMNEWSKTHISFDAKIVEIANNFINLARDYYQTKVVNN